MKADASKPSIMADEVGIHFLHNPGRDIVVTWGEIEGVDAARQESADGSSFLEVYIDHVSGVDFRFHDVEDGYGQVMLAMEQHLVGFSRAQAEAAGTWEQKQNTASIWQRDETIQPIQLRPPKIDARDPTPEERIRIESTQRASISACAKLLGRPLEADELQCIHTGFENGMIVGSIARPLSDILVRRQAEILGRVPPE